MKLINTLAILLITVMFTMPSSYADHRRGDPCNRGDGKIAYQRGFTDGLNDYGQMNRGRCYSRGYRDGNRQRYDDIDGVGAIIASSVLLFLSSASSADNYDDSDYDYDYDYIQE